MTRKASVALQIIIPDFTERDSLTEASSLWHKLFFSFFGDLVSTHTEGMTIQKQPKDG